MIKSVKMPHSWCPKKLCNPVIDQDLISNLPTEIREQILTKLPIKEAVKTSILSTKWRHTWASIPLIVLRDDELVPDLDGPEAISSFVQIVDFLLSKHKGPILKFDLSTSHLCTEAIDRWILNLSRNGITEVSLLLKLSNSMYRIPSNFFFCSALQDIHLSKCSIKMPLGFQGFKLLRTLKLDECSISAVDIEKLISSSPQLVELLLEITDILGNLQIHAKKLKILRIIAIFSDLRIDAPQLAVARILKIPDSNAMPFPLRPCSKHKLFLTLGGLLNIRKLVLIGVSLPYILGETEVELPRALSCLTHLALDADLSDRKQSKFVFSLLRSAINLKKLYFAVRTPGLDNESTSSSFWKKRSNLGFALAHLQKVSILRFVASEPVLAFVKLILCSASVLKEITICRRESIEEEYPMVFKQVLEFPRASSEAEVFFQ